MKFGLIIKHGSFEHPCTKEDDGRCSLACPNYCTPDGYPARDASILGLSLEKLSCAVLEKGEVVIDTDSKNLRRWVLEKGMEVEQCKD